MATFCSLCSGQDRVGVSSVWGRTPFGSQTPSYGTGAGGRTPMYGSQTPLHGDGEVLISIQVRCPLPSLSPPSLPFRWQNSQLWLHDPFTRSLPDPSTRGQCLGPQCSKHPRQVGNMHVIVHACKLHGLVSCD